MEIKALREKIDMLDGEIQRLLCERFEVVKKIGEEKKKLGCSKPSTHEWSMNRARLEDGAEQKGGKSKRQGLLCFLRSRLLTPNRVARVY